MIGHTLESLKAYATSQVCLGVDADRHTVTWASTTWPEGVTVSDADFSQSVLRAWHAEVTGRL